MTEIIKKSSQFFEKIDNIGKLLENPRRKKREREKRK